MVFSSTVFLFLFLPLVLAATFAVSRSARNSVLLMASLGFYAWGEGWYTSVLIFSIVMNWLLGLAMQRFRSRSGEAVVLGAAIVLNLGMLIAFKYANFLVDNLNQIAIYFSLAPIHLDPVHLPIGISFFTFQALSYVIDVRRGQVSANANLIDYGMYKAFFPQLIAGPIVRYVDVAKDVKGRLESCEVFVSGFRRFVAGLAKKVLIANTLSIPADAIFGLFWPRIRYVYCVVRGNVLRSANILRF